jgi:hypothetical protein
MTSGASAERAMNKTLAQRDAFHESAFWRNIALRTA